MPVGGGGRRAAAARARPSVCAVWAVGGGGAWLASPVEFWKTNRPRGSRRRPSRPAVAIPPSPRIDHPGGDGAWRASAPGASGPASPAWPLSLLKRAVGVFEGGDKNRPG